MGLNPSGILSRVDQESHRFGSLLHYLNGPRPFQRWNYDEQVQLKQQLEFVLKLERGQEKEFTERQKDEQKFYNEIYLKQASDKNAARLMDPDEFPVTNCGLEPYSEEVFKQMMPLASKRVLEIGGGGGLFGLWMALQGAQVTILDVSDKALEFAKTREQELRKHYPERFKFPVEYCVVPAEQSDLKFPEAVFDYIFAFAVVHHLETESLAYALNKVLKPGGAILFPYEPFYFLRVLHWLRYSPPVLKMFPESSETQFERRLGRQDLDYLKKYFTVELLPSNFIFFNLAHRFFADKKHPGRWPFFKILIWPQKKTKWSYDQFGDVASRCLAREYALLRKFPFLKFFCGNVSMILQKKKG